MILNYATTRYSKERKDYVEGKDYDEKSNIEVICEKKAMTGTRNFLSIKSIKFTLNKTPVLQM